MTDGRFARFGLVYNGGPGGNMNRRNSSIFGAVLLVAGLAGASSAAVAQTFQNYRCADGTQFIVGFFEYDKRAHLQIDGQAVTLAKRFGLSGSRYSGGGVTLKIGKAGTTIKHAKRPVTACELT
jgi:membrane-bound inhibitor of C-type lysozyme